jgi:hypothetical protein
MTTWSFPSRRTSSPSTSVEPKYARAHLDGVLFTESPIHVSIPRSDKTHESGRGARLQAARLDLRRQENTNLVIASRPPDPVAALSRASRPWASQLPRTKRSTAGAKSRMPAGSTSKKWR